MLKKILYFLLIVNCQLSIAFAAPNLTTEINMDIRAATATAAKKDATDSAMRSAAIQILARYSDRAIVENLIMGADDAALQNLVASTSISNEKSSKTAYSARLAITLDRPAVEKWYNENNIPNFLAAADESKDRMVISIDLANGLSDWAALNHIMREDGDNYGLTLRSIFRNSASAWILTNKRRKFQNVCISNGWNISSRDGTIRISK